MVACMRNGKAWSGFTYSKISSQKAIPDLSFKNNVVKIYGAFFIVIVLSSTSCCRAVKERTSFIQDGHSQISNQQKKVNGKENLEQEEYENDFCEAQMTLASQLDSDLQNKQNLLTFILGKMEEKSNNHQLCLHMKNSTNNYCRRISEKGGNAEAKCGGKDYDNKITQYINTKGCINALILGQTLIYDYVWPEGGSALDKWLYQYEMAMFSGGISSDLSKIYLKSKDLMTDIRDDLRKILKKFSTQEIKEIWKERKVRIVGIMCLIGDGNNADVKDKIILNSDLLVIKAQFDDLIKRAVKAMEPAFRELGYFIITINKKGGYIDRLKEIHSDFHTFRMKKLGPILEEATQSNTVQQTESLVNKLPHNQQRKKRKKHKVHPSIDPETNLLEKKSKRKEKVSKEIPHRSEKDKSSLLESGSTPIALTPPIAEPGVDPVTQVFPLSLSPSVKVPQPHPTTNISSSQHMPTNPNINNANTPNNVNIVTPPAPTSQQNQDVYSTIPQNYIPSQIEDLIPPPKNGVSLKNAIQDILTELNVFKVEEDTVSGYPDEVRLQTIIESSFLDFKDVDCLMKLFFAPQAALVTIIQLFEEFTPDPIIDLREWFNKTMNEGGMISEGVVADLKGPNMTNIVDRFSKFMDLDYQKKKRDGLYSMDNLAGISITEPTISTDFSSSSLELFKSINIKDKESQLSVLKDTEKSSQSFIHSSSSGRSSQDADPSPTVALLSSDDGIPASKQFECPNKELLQNNLNEMISLMTSGVRQLDKVTLSTVLLSLLTILLSSFLF